MNTITRVEAPEGDRFALIALPIERHSNELIKQQLSPEMALGSA
jgi:hypothetical protein